MTQSSLRDDVVSFRRAQALKCLPKLSQSLRDGLLIDLLGFLVA
jgi:hypothetical protein